MFDPTVAPLDAVIDPRRCPEFISAFSGPASKPIDRPARPVRRETVEWALETEHPSSSPLASSTIGETRLADIRRLWELPRRSTPLVCPDKDLVALSDFARLTPLLAILPLFRPGERTESSDGDNFADKRILGPVPF